MPVPYRLWLIKTIRSGCAELSCLRRRVCAFSLVERSVVRFPVNFRSKPLATPLLGLMVPLLPDRLIAVQLPVESLHK